MISVIMSIYNEDIKWIQDSIFSILNQDFIDFEFLIVVDNPNNFEAIQWLSNCKDHRLSFFINPENKGLIFSLNFLIDKCNGDYIARMDADDISLSNRFSLQLKYLIDGGYDLVGSNVEVISALGEHMYNSNKVIGNKYIDNILLLGTVPLVHPTYFGKKEVFKKCLYNSLATYAEDMEFIAHARVLGYKIGNCPEILLKYRSSSLSITKSNAYISYTTAMSVKDSFKNYKKNSNYIFSQKIINFDNYKIKKFNNRQVFMNLAKAEFYKKKYLKGLIFLFKAIFSDSSFFRVLYINIMQSYFVYKDLKK